MPSKRQIPPAWFMGLAGASFGLTNGFIVVTLPQALVAQHVPETTIAAVTAAAFSPGFYIFLLGPILDVRFSRRFYALLLTLTAASLVAACMSNTRHVTAVTIMVTLTWAAITLAFNALCGWLSTVSPKSQENQISAWLTAMMYAGTSIMSVVGGEFVRHFSMTITGILLGSMIILPTATFLWIPAPGPDRRLANESFREFFGEILALLRRREVLIALALFVLPCGTFSLANMLAGLGNDFRASPRAVSLLSGVGIAAAGVCGSLLLPPLAKRMPLRPLYLTIGVVGACFTLILIILPRMIGSFAVALIGENLFSALGVACGYAICFETAGQRNPLAATNFAILNAAYTLPMSYMLIADGWGYGRYGLSGAFGVDAGLGIAACAGMGLLFMFQRRGEAQRLGYKAQVAE